MKIALLFALLTSQVFAKQLVREASEQSQTKETKKVMHQALESLIKLIPYMPEMNFKDPKNEKIIDLHLNKIASAFKSARHIKEFKSPGFTPNYQIIKEHLDDTIMTFNSNNKTFARLRLNETTAICLSCHTQLPKDKMTSYILDSRKVNRSLFANEYEYGNFQFLLRSYRSALSAYKRSINERLEKRKELLKIKNILGEQYDHFDQILFNTFKKILIIYTKILRQPENAIKLFNEYVTAAKIHAYIQNDLKAWISQLSRWQGNKYIQQKFSSDLEVKSFIEYYAVPLEKKSTVSGDYDVDLLIVSGVLGNYLQQNPNTKLTAEVLYWEGLTENRIGKNIFFTLGDLYLKECITRYPRAAIAKKCFKEYKDEMTLRFTGSIGTNIPKSKQQELKRLESLLK
jgi:hypothetical protein